jgi:hypothetical protein
MYRAISLEHLFACDLSVKKLNYRNSAKSKEETMLRFHSTPKVGQQLEEKEITCIYLPLKIPKYI